MENFETPLIEIIAFESKDVIATRTTPKVDEDGYGPVVKL